MDETQEEMQEPVDNAAEEQAEVPQAGQELNAGAVVQKFAIPPQLQKAYEKIVLAGMKVMFDPKTHEMALKELDREGPIEDRVANGVTGLMLLLWQESNQTMPPQLVVPAATALYMQAADFMKKSGEPMTNEQLSAGLIKTISNLLQKFGVDTQKIQQLFSGGADPAAAMQKAGVSPAEQSQMGQSAPGGILGKAMGGAA